MTWDSDREIMRLRKINLCGFFSWGLEEVAFSGAPAQFCRHRGEGMERKWAPPPLWALRGGSAFAKDCSLQSSWQTKFRTWRSLETWGLAALPSLPSGPWLAPCPCSPLPSAVACLSHCRLRTRKGGGDLLHCGLGNREVKYEFYGILPLTGLGPWVSSRCISVSSPVKWEMRRLPSKLWDEMRYKGSSTVLVTQWAGHQAGREGSKVESGLHCLCDPGHVP